MDTQQKPVLTNRQAEALAFILANACLYGPTVREIATAMGITSPNGVVCHLRSLEAKGLIRRHPKKARGIQLVGGDA
jgi:repressor LexA